MASKSSSIEPSVSSLASASPYLALNSSSSDTLLTPNTPTPTQHSTLNEPSTKQKRTYNNYHDDNYDYPQPSHQSGHGLSLTAYCGGIGSGSGNGSGMTQGLLMADAEPYGITSVDMLSGTANKNRLVAVDRKKMKAHHNQPIKVGVSVGYALTNRWAVNTGVTYSYLSSDFTADGEPKQTQKLHYVGIPLSASYSVLKGRKAEVYVTAGGEVEKLVKGTVSSENSLPTNSNEKVKESRPQFSAKVCCRRCLSLHAIAEHLCRARRQLLFRQPQFGHQCLQRPSYELLSERRRAVYREVKILPISDLPQINSVPLHPLWY